MAQRLSATLLLALLGAAGTAAAQSAPGPSTTEDDPPAATEDPSEGPAESDRTATGLPPSSSAARTPAPAPAPRSGSVSRRTTPTRPGASSERAPEGEEEEEDEDSWGVFYLQLLGGYSYADIISIRQTNFLPETERLEGSGFFGGAGLGFRLKILTLGAQATLASYAPGADDGFELGTVIGTIALHLPVPGIQPYFRIGAGYAWMGKANYSAPGISETRVYGFVVEGGFGVDFKLARAISIGLGVDAAYLNLGRQSASELGMIDDVNFEEDGDAVGYQIRGHVHLTFHI